jgi:hypothetical protein
MKEERRDAAKEARSDRRQDGWVDVENNRKIF